VPSTVSDATPAPLAMSNPFAPLKSSTAVLLLVRFTRPVCVPLFTTS
jgi:hypothetical protein